MATAAASGTGAQSVRLTLWLLLIVYVFNFIDRQIMAILALSMKERGHLTGNTLVATVMSNLGLRMAMAEHGITMIDSYCNAIDF